jgi:hypothetical protein
LGHNKGHTRFVVWEADDWGLEDQMSGWLEIGVLEFVYLTVIFID